MMRLPVHLLSLAALVATPLLLGPSCGPEPVGVDDCRTIEDARCKAATACGFVDDADACRRFYRDHCLHGFAAPETPGGAQIDGCVSAIQTAGDCAAADPAQSVAECLDGDDTITLIAGAEVDTICDVVRTPEQTRECLFLSEEPEPGAGGAGGSPGD